jgi:hypothetical protein
MNRTEDVRKMQRRGDWRSLAERARVEMDPEKLINLVSELNSALEERQSFTSGCEFHGNRESHENRSREWHSN